MSAQSDHELRVRALAKAKMEWDRIQALLDYLTPAQREFVEDPADQKAVISERQTGKTEMNVVYMFLEALQMAGCSVIYIGLSLGNAKKAAWKKMLDINFRFQLGGVPFNNSAIKFPNGSTVELMGLESNDSLKERLRGGQYRLAVIDECGSWKRDLQELVEDVLNMAMAAYEGTIVMVSTPGHIKKYFYEVATGKIDGWSLHTLKLADNPNEQLRARQARKAAAMLKAHGPTWPAYRREFFGEWVADDATRCYPSLRNELRVPVLGANGLPSGVQNGHDLRSPSSWAGEYSGGNLVPSLPQLQYGDKWTRIVAHDPGYNSALVAMAYCRGFNALFVYRTWKKQGMGETDVAIQVKAWEQEQGVRFTHYIIDSAGRQNADEMRRHHQIPWKASDKHTTAKDISIDLLNGDVSARAVLFVKDECNELLREMQDLCWDEDLLKETGERKEEKSSGNHLCDALLYGWRDSYHYTGKSERLPKEPTKDPGEVHMQMAIKRAAQERLLDPAVQRSQRQFQTWLQKAARP